jgi:hypothetical protein
MKALQEQIISKQTKDLETFHSEFLEKNKFIFCRLDPNQHFMFNFFHEKGFYARPSNCYGQIKGSFWVGVKEYEAFFVFYETGEIEFKLYSQNKNCEDYSSEILDSLAINLRKKFPNYKFCRNNLYRGIKIYPADIIHPCSDYKTKINF